MVKLAGWQGEEVLEQHLGGGEVVVGRDESCAVRVESSQVSRRHCRIEPLPGGKLRLVDLGSKNGTYVNGKRVSAGELADYDVVRLGDVELVCLPDGDDARRALASRAPRMTPQVLEPAHPPNERRLGARGLGRQTDEDLQRSSLRERLFQLALASKDVVSDVDVRHLLGALLREAMTFAGAEWGAVYLTEDGPEGMSPEVALPSSAPTAPPEVLRVLFEAALRTRRTCQRAFCAPPLPGAPRETAAGSILCVPLDTLAGLGGWRFVDVPASGAAPETRDTSSSSAGSGSGTGALVLVANHGLDALTDTDRDMLETIAGQAAAVVQRAWLYRQATVDAVTQLTNRAWTERVLGEELRRMRVRRGPLSVVVMDLDHFKRINDTYGHPAGDAVLRAVARRVRGALREGDLVGRWGGDELLVALAGVASDGAETAAQKVARAVREPPIIVATRRTSTKTAAAGKASNARGTTRRMSSTAPAPQPEPQPEPPAGAPIRVTLSLGIATYPEHGGTLELLVKHADRALYAAKARGRDQAVVYSAELDLTDKLSTDLVIDVDVHDTRARLSGPALSLQGGPTGPIALPEQAVVTLGRSTSCDVVLDHSDVSPLHATITGTGTARLVEDRSIGGTHLNGRRLGAPSPLEPGDVLTIGPWDLRVVADEARAVEDEPARPPVPLRAPGGGVRPRLLLVDDDPALRAAIESLLADYDVTTVRTVDEAMQALRPGTMKAGVAGLPLPDGDGAADGPAAPVSQAPPSGPEEAPPAEKAP